MWIVWTLAGCSMLGMGGDIEKDLLRMCSLATEIEADGGIPAGKQAAKLSKKVAKAKLGPGARALWKAVEATPPKARIEVLDRLLDEQGVDEFHCPALRRVIMK